MVSHIKFHRLVNPVQDYAWGSDRLIQEMFGWDGGERPLAEVWYGAHQSAPSITVEVGPDAPPREFYFPSEGLPARPSPYLDLGELIRSSPLSMLGKTALDNFGPRLPYLLKLLAAAQPLSLQVHPKAHMARAGFQRENALGISLCDPKRNYKDSSHKPEMLVALTDFEGLCGFRRPQRVLQILDGLAGETVRQMYLAMKAQPNARGIENALEAALTLGRKDFEMDGVRTMNSIRERLKGQSRDNDEVSRSYRTALELFHLYPSDPGVLVSLLLNHVSLTPGEAIFVPAGQMHAYLHGLGVEIMANSDNVLRAGLTTKNIDVPELISVTDFAPSSVTRPLVTRGERELQKFHGVAEEFSVYYGKIAGSELVETLGPRIILCLSGPIELRSVENLEIVLDKGQSVFVPDSLGSIELRGKGTFVMAFVPNV